MTSTCYYSSIFSAVAPSDSDIQEYKEILAAYNINYNKFTARILQQNIQNQSTQIDLPSSSAVPQK